MLWVSPDRGLCRSLRPRTHAIPSRHHIRRSPARVSRRSGDVLVVFSDGVTEALNADAIEFGEDRLLTCVDAHRGDTATVLLDSLLDAVRELVWQLVGDQHADSITAGAVGLVAGDEVECTHAPKDPGSRRHPIELLQDSVR